MAQLQSTGITGSLVVTGTITAQEFHTEYVSSSILFESGSTAFGNTNDDIHNFTGSLIVNRDPGTNQGTVLTIENKGDYGSAQDIILRNPYDRDIGIKFQTLGGEYYQWLDSNGDDAMIFSAAGSTRATDATLILQQDHSVVIPNGDLTVGGGDVAINKAAGAATLTFFRDANLSTNTLIGQLLFEADYQDSPIDYARIDVKSNASSVRTDMDFVVKSTSGNLETALKLQGGSATPKAFFYNEVSASAFIGDGSQLTNVAAATATSAGNADTVDTKHATDFTLDYVTGNGGTTGNAITVGGVDSTGGVNITRSSSNTQLKLKRTTTATGEFNIYTNTDSLFFHNVGQSTYPFIIDSSGNVGIGTTNSLAAHLHIYEPAASNTATTDMLKLQAYTGDFGATPAAIALAFKFQDSNNSTNEARIRMATVNDTDYGDNDEAASNLIFSTTNGGTESDKMIITGRGEIGIGTTSPGGKLDVAGTITSRPGASSNSALSIGVLEITNSGTPSQIKITTNIPYSGAGASVHAHSVTIKGFQYGSANTVNLQISWHVYNSSFYNRAVTSSGGWAPTVRLAVENNKVVIHLASPGYWPKMYVESLYNAFGSTAHAQGWSWADAAISADANTPNEVVPYKVNFGNNFLMDSSGNVGIGTPSPASPLHINTGTGVNNANTVIIDRAGTSDYSGISFATAGTVDWSIGHNSAGNFEVFENGSDATTRLTVETGGNVGIGVVNPSTLLHVGGDIYTTAQVRLNQGQGITWNNGDNYIKGISGYHLQFTTYDGTSAQQEVLRLTGGASASGGGRVGIGVTSPSEKLEVDGNIKADSFVGGYGNVAGYQANADVHNWDGSTSTFNWVKIGSVNSSNTSTRLMVELNTWGDNNYPRQNTYHVTVSKYSTGLSLSNYKISGTDYNSTLELVVDSNLDIWVKRVLTWAHAFLAKPLVQTGGATFNTDFTGNNLTTTQPTGTPVLKNNGGFRVSTDALSTITHDYRYQYFKSDGDTKMTILNDGNVGIGTTSPSTNLHVHSAGGSGVVTQIKVSQADDGAGHAGADAILQSSGWGEAYLKLGGHRAYAGGGDFNIESSSDLVLKSNGNNTRMFIASGGNIGIGTTNPNHALDIYSNTNVPLRIHRPSNANLDSSGAWGIGFSTRGDAATSTTDTRAGIFSAYNGDLFFAVDSGGRVDDDPDGNVAMWIEGSNKNVGIGTTNPDSPLNVYKSTGTSGSSTGSTLFSLNNYVGSDLSQQKTFIDFNLLDDNANYTPQVRIGAEVGRNADANAISKESAGAFVVYTADGTDETGGGSLTEKMRVDYAGNVGIGTFSPVEKLEVVGNAILDASNANLKIKAGVGGTKGDIQWTFNTDSTVYASAGITYDNRGTDGFLIDSGYPITLDYASGYVRFSNAGSEKARIDTNGRLSVYREGNRNGGTILIGGNTSGTNKWSFLAGAHYDQATGSGNGAGSAGIALIGSYASSTENRVHIGGNPYEMNAATSIHFNTHTSNTSTLGGTERMVITSGGLVGIGTTSPDSNARLHVAGTGKFYSTIGTGDNVRTGLAHYDTTAQAANVGGQLVLGYKYHDNGSYTEGAIIKMYKEDSTSGNYGSGLKFQVRNHGNDLSTKMILTPDGDIGFGQNTYNGGVYSLNSSGAVDTNWGLQVQRTDAVDDYNVRLKFYPVASSARKLGFWNSQTDTWMAYFDGSTNSNNNFIINGGNLGIGTTSPSSKLHVAGEARATSLLVSDSNSGLIKGHTDPYHGMMFRGTPNSATGYGITAGDQISFYEYGGDFRFYRKNNIGGGILSEIARIQYSNSFIDSNLGIGTTSPAGKLHVTSGNSGDCEVIIEADTDNNNENDNPRLILKQDGGLISATLGINGDADSAFTGCLGNGAYINASSFQIASGGTQGLTVDGSGNVGIGTNAPNGKFHVYGTGTVGRFHSSNTYSDIVFQNSSGTGGFLNFAGTTSFNVYIGGGSGTNLEMSVSNAGTLTVSGDVVAYGSPSDIRLKENIKPVEKALDKVLKLEGVTFDWKDLPDAVDRNGEPVKLKKWKNDIGFIAQEVREVVPELVRENEEGMLSVRHQGVIPILLEAVKEQQELIKKLENRIEKLENK